jgi:hypothetical protein
MVKMGLQKPLLVLEAETAENLLQQQQSAVIVFYPRGECYHCGESVNLFFEEPKKFVFEDEEFLDIEYVQCVKCNQKTMYLLSKMGCQETL